MQRPCVDSALIARWRDAIDQWEATGEGATSSITGGGAIRALEVAFGDRLDGRPCLSLGSGTAALAACLVGVGVKPGDHVLTSALDWPAATEAIRWIGAIPRYVDVGRATATISPARVRQACDDRVTGLVATHLFGIPADVPTLRSALPSGIAIVEDCAQALGAQLDDAAVGTLGDAAAFSFGPGKMIDAGEAGMSVFASEDSWGRAVVATQHRVRALATEARASVHLSSRMHPMAAVLALTDLEDLDSRISSRQADVQGWLGEHPEIALVGGDARRRPSFWRVPVRHAPEDFTNPLPPELALGTPSQTPIARELIDEVRLAHVPTAQ